MGNSIPLIDQLNISAEEKEITIAKVKNMLRINNEKLITSANITRLFEEWKMIAQRIKKGGMLLDSVPMEGSYETKEHFRALNDLYILQLKLLGMYEVFFKRNLSTQEQFQRAYNEIYKIVS